MSERVNEITKEQERQGGAVSIKYNYEHNGETKSQTRSVVNERLYIPGYAEVGGEHKFCNEELWAAFASNRSGSDDVSDYIAKYPDKKIDAELANSFMSAMNPENVDHDDLAKRFYVKTGASTEELSSAGVGIATGKTVVEREKSIAEKQLAAGKISDLEIKDVKLRNFENELAEGATQVVTSDAQGKEWTKTFINNRKYLTYSGDEPKREVFERLAKDNDFVKKDGFAMNHYIDYETSYEDQKALLDANQGLNTTRGHRAADYMVSLTEKIDDMTLVNVDHMSSAAYTVMREDYIKKAEEAKAAKDDEKAIDSAEAEQAQESKEELDNVMSGTSRGR